MRAPQCRDTIERGQRGIGITGDVEHREVECDEGMQQHTDGRADQHELPGDRRPHHCLPTQVTPRGAEDAEEGLRAGKHQCEDQGELTEFGNHQVPPLS